MTTNTNKPAAIHPFEKSGLGRAPYRVTGSHDRKFQACQGAPIQAGGTCDYCGTAIMTAFDIVSSDGVKFKVGCDCVGKVAKACAGTDAERSMRKLVDDVNAIKRKATNKRTGARIAAAVLVFEAHRDELHMVWDTYPPMMYARSVAEQIDWMLKHAGRAGKLRTAKQIEALAKARGW